MVHLLAFAIVKRCISAVVVGQILIEARNRLIPIFLAVKVSSSVGRWENKPGEIFANNAKRVILFNMAHGFWLNVANISNLGAQVKEKRRADVKQGLRPYGQGWSPC